MLLITMYLEQNGTTVAQSMVHSMWLVNYSLPVNGILKIGSKYLKTVIPIRHCKHIQVHIH